MTQSPNPWSREGSFPANQPSRPSGDAGAPSQGSDPNVRNAGAPTPAGGPQGGPPRPTQPTAPASGPAAQTTTGGPGYGPGQQPPGPAGMTPPTAYLGGPQPQVTTTKTKPRRAGKFTAAFAAVALFAAGIGAGSAVLADHYIGDDQPAAIGQSDDSSDASQGTTVVQADPSNPDWSAVADAAQQSTVAIQVAGEQGSGQGSGVVIDDEGHIVTNNHVVSGARQVLVTLNGHQYEATVVGTDPSTDLAVIQLTDPPEDLAPIAWGDSNALVVGDPVMAIGNPLGLSNTVTTGIVSALDRPVATRASGESGTDAVVTAAIQTSAAINPGNSGGALVNASGELVGITSSIATVSGSDSGQSGNIGIGFAIGSDQARNVAQQLIENGEAVHAQIGVTARDLNQVGPMGAEVAQVTEGSPAAEAGLQPGDVVTAVDDRPVSSTTQLVGMIRAKEVGQTVSITYERDGESSTVELAPVAASQ